MFLHQPDGGVHVGVVDPLVATAATGSQEVILFLDCSAQLTSFHFNHLAGLASRGQAQLTWWLGCPPPARHRPVTPQQLLRLAGGIGRKRLSGLMEEVDCRCKRR